MKTEITFLRHAQTDANIGGKFSGRLDLPLNETGRKQAENAARQLQEKHFDVVVYGKAKRVRETAREVLDRLENKPETLLLSGGIREMDFGVFEGMHYLEIAEQYPDEWKKYMENWQTYTFPDGDNVSEFYALCREWIDGIVAEYCGKRVLIVAHKGFILNCLSALLTQDGSDVLGREIGNAQTITLEL